MILYQAKTILIVVGHHNFASFTDGGKGYLPWLSGRLRSSGQGFPVLSLLSAIPH